MERVGGLRLLRAAVAAPEGIGEKRQRRRIGRAAVCWRRKGCAGC